MVKRNVSSDVLKLVNQKTGKKISPTDVKKLAGKVNQSTMKDEAQLRKLIKQVGALVNVKVSEQLTNEIVQAVKKSGMNPNNLEQMIKMMSRK
ncbi:hypothetical protein PRECH8_01700 [Insulibacter thermoxylanivorax]|uniref:Stage VI sporulation protein F n=1 Tax=Insulibacter thermoxylanivorax TaxID=2749268 RepID=A0A916VEQ9_9BACL|nr:stage VI sporulation protein F [Insulibacter thermoxylanivorax]GFR36874.1 hypothetical protein PRECH8_01700 [Insulibacter thermoxylanivorax]